MGNEKDDTKKQEKWTQEDGLRFLKELREMPYDTNKVGKVFVTIHAGKLSDMKDSEKEQERAEENKP